MSSSTNGYNWAIAFRISVGGQRLRVDTPVPKIPEVVKQEPRQRPNLRVLMLDPAGSSVQVTHNLSNHLGKLGCTVHVFTAPHWMRAVGDCQRGSYRARIVFYRGTQLRSYAAVSRAATYFWRCVRLVQHIAAMLVVSSRARNFDLVHTQTLSVPLLDYIFLRMMARHTPLVCTVHELVPHNSKLRRLTGAALSAIYRTARLLFVYTDYTRNRLVTELGIAAEKIVTIPHGSTEHMLQLAGAPRRTEPEMPIVLFIGGIRRDKGLDILMQAAWHLRRKVPSFKIQVAGAPGFDLTTINRLITELGIQDLVEFRLGYVPEREFAAYLSNATVVALPYRRIEQSGVAIAACTFGKAIVATRCGGVEELVTSAGNGLLVPVDDPVALAEALALLLTDDEKRRRFEARSHNYTREILAWEPIAAQTLAGYQTVLKQSPNSK